MRNLGVKILIIAAVFTVFVMLPKIADADGYSLEINPGIIKIKASPPALVKTGIRIKNLSDNPIELGYILKPFVASEKNSGQIKYLLYSDYTSKNFNFLQRIKVLEDNQAISKIILSPKQEKNLTILIDLPQEEEQADHYFSIVFLTQSQEKLDSNYSRIIEGIGTNVLVSIGTNQYKALIRDFSTSVFVSQGPVKFNLKIENIGKNFITTSGYIIIDNIFGQTVGKIDIKPANILGKSTLEILKDDVVWQEKFLLGIYTAKLYLNYDDSTSLYREFRFITIPIKILAILTIAGFIIIFIKNRSKTH
ncbi:MAG: hypothetical protein A3H50_03310 [Candidatus Levybacteria bacterium RIFCSPLOWO2_02_FULL_37_10]|nr:MAG: hypothetical protein A2860_03035 [Candidatus Levybacteria bacterium RIFCSPHIGHO2_01_FULL_37_33]OGH16251.1 MAG: hypothetical protein A3C97_03025 [Candidatus Levybacteria bacterium RIFCSPHIGHO2_02_FULL_37_11]OGH29510.1 MAG: hypothetical protein A3F30_02660 [Candidatus Levybacteria bacterium RIFCSPHIGHO2_12_FULL_37_12]OGH43622.1 MAG: hypothetical protein A3H50_03310 [Candidatus Levybacteria bacterium RIFCSPLOWO2_02_FULL_37_10]